MPRNDPHDLDRRAREAAYFEWRRRGGPCLSEEETRRMYFRELDRIRSWETGGSPASGTGVGTMRACAIYYPYINVPQSPWFTRVLLYWDDVGAIVPYEYIQNPDRLGHYMVGLVREGLVTQVVPSMHLGRAPNFADAFIEYVDQKVRQPERLQEAPWVHVHMEKLQEVGEKLCERDLAREDSTRQYSSWYEVEPHVAFDFRAYLAAVLGQLTGPEKYYPITDREWQLNPFLSQPNFQIRARSQKLLLEGILPGPTGAIEPARLADFKAAHESHLRRFRREIEDKISELAVIDDENARNGRLRDIVRTMQETVREIATLMQEQRNWGHLDFANLCAVIGSSISAWKAVIDQDLAFGLAGASLSLAPAVYRAFRGSEINLEDKPLAYAALARRAVASPQ